MACALVQTEHVPDAVAVDALQPKLTKALGQPVSACPFAERWGGNPRQLQLPLRELRFLFAEPFHCLTHLRESSGPRNLRLQLQGRLGSRGSGRRTHGLIAILQLIGLWVRLFECSAAR